MFSTGVEVFHSGTAEIKPRLKRGTALGLRRDGTYSIPVEGMFGTSDSLHWPIT